MKKSLIWLSIIILANLTLAEAVPGKNPRVEIKTGLGNIIIELYPDRAPLTVANFLRYVDAGLFKATAFFRTVTLANQPDNPVKIEVIQGGEIPAEKEFPAVGHETTRVTGLHHLDGTVSMARAEPGTATSQFFICVNDQPELDFNGRRNPDGQGFAAFGKVISGMEVVRKIHQQPAQEQRLSPEIRIVNIERIIK